MADESRDRPDGFLGRWARRKNDALQGKPLDEPAPKPAAGQAPLPAQGTVAAVPAQAGPAPEKIENEPVKPLSLDDVKDLTKDSDFKPFMGRGVEPGVRNAAMKKLFADPHFNVMDRMDIYIDDYSQPDPLPLSMLRQMASAKFLKLFDEEEETDKDKDKDKKEEEGKDSTEDPTREISSGPDPDSVAQSSPALPAIPTPDSPPQASEPAGTRQENHAHIDLRLQPDHAAQDPSPGRGAA
jgi:hypothetical protein